ncbi:putative pwi domain mrna processing protein [Golovinomyces cichoracearum]|uniref:Putative pwi domain mrna processing protein n=1 Tax=Golovinomyces cichoracearum TaxID=62708 RepID=A0A420HD46_9PEZI|nr:putative pwi domain mrna processing protein [Golovinomyces cichoracearum]
MACSVDAKLLKSTKFPPEFNQKVDMEKVNAEVIKKWIARRIPEILGNDDDVVIELCFNLIEGSRYPDIKKTQIQLTGFLDKDTASFCKELWKLCLSAQTNPQGVPKQLLEAKKLELIQEKIEAEKSAEEARRRKEEKERRDRETSNVKNRESDTQDRGYRSAKGDSWRGAQVDREPGRRRLDRHGERNDTRAFDRRPKRQSRSPPHRRHSRDHGKFRPTRKLDTYIPHRRTNRRRTSTSRSRSSSITRSRSRSIPIRRGRSVSRSRSPTPRRRSRSPPRRGDFYRSRSEKYRRGRSQNRRSRRRSPDRSDSYRSRSRSFTRSPRPIKRRRYRSRSSSISPHRSRRFTSSRSHSTSSSRSPSRTIRRRRARSRVKTKNSPIPDSDDEKGRTRLDSRRGREISEHCATRGVSRNKSPRNGRSPQRTPRQSRSPSRNRTSVGSKPKRRRSIQYYEPANRRRQNNTSVHLPDHKGDRKSDFIDDNHKFPDQDHRTKSSSEIIVSEKKSDH